MDAPWRRPGNQDGEEARVRAQRPAVGLCAGWFCAAFVHPSAQASNRKGAVALCACAHKIPILPIRGPIAPHNGLNPRLVRTSCAVRAAAKRRPRALLNPPQSPRWPALALRRAGRTQAYILRLLPTSVACTRHPGDVACTCTTPAAGRAVAAATVRKDWGGSASSWTNRERRVGHPCRVRLSWQRVSAT